MSAKVDELAERQEFIGALERAGIEAHVSLPDDEVFVAILFEGGTSVLYKFLAIVAPLDGDDDELRDRACGLAEDLWDEWHEEGAPPDKEAEVVAEIRRRVWRYEAVWPVTFDGEYDLECTVLIPSFDLPELTARLNRFVAEQG